MVKLLGSSSSCRCICLPSAYAIPVQRSYNGYPVETIEQNPDGDRLIILLHGFGASTFSWRTIAGHLATMGHVIAYDRPGFGLTPLVSRNVTPDPYSLEGQVQLLSAVIAAEARGRDVILLGHSSGGLVAAEYALRFPQTIKGLILESPAIWRKPPIPNWVNRVLSVPSLEKLADRLLGSFDKAGMKILRDSFWDQHNLTQYIIDGYRAPMEQASWKVSLWRFMTASQRSRVRSRLANFEVPVFVITGDHDVIIKVEDTFKVTERIPGHSIYVVPNASHLAHEEHPDDFMRVVRRFIERVSPSGISPSSTSR